MNKRDELMELLRIKTQIQNPTQSYFKTMLSETKSAPSHHADIHAELYGCGYASLSNRAKDEVLYLDKVNITKRPNENLAKYLNRRKDLISDLSAKTGYIYKENEIDLNTRRKKECDIASVLYAQREIANSR